MRRRATASLAMATLGLLLGGSFVARAQAPGAEAPRGRGAAAGVEAEVFVVLATEAEGTIDPALAAIPALRQPPFNAFHTMSVLSRTGAQLSIERPVDVTLPNGRHLRIELEGAQPDGRFPVRISINTPGQADYLPLLQIVASPGIPFFVAGQNWQGGTLVIGVRIGQRPAVRKAS
jgi:hypothetical protein